MIPLLEKIHQDLHITAQHLASCKLLRCEQPPLTGLEVVDIHFDGRPFVLSRDATSAWLKMNDSAASEGIALAPYSGFRSYLHQSQLIRKKLQKGLPLEVILTETAIPGFSEHHSGRAIDICADGHYELNESFENTTAFAWLARNASSFGFRLSYPRGNDAGIIYEPWHWYFVGTPG